MKTKHDGEIDCFLTSHRWLNYLKPLLNLNISSPDKKHKNEATRCHTEILENIDCLISQYKQDSINASLS